jgi:predicted transcriptional regulator
MADTSGSLGVKLLSERFRNSTSVSKYPGVTPLVRELGIREREVLSVLWSQGSANVQQVAGRLSTPLAYTTVMTTLDRLFKKGLLQREKKCRAFIYSSNLTAREIEAQRASHLIRRFFSDSREQPDMLLSCLVDAVDHYDTSMLDQLESKIRSVRAHSLALASESCGASRHDSLL